MPSFDGRLAQVAQGESGLARADEASPATNVRAPMDSELRYSELL